MHFKKAGLECNAILKGPIKDSRYQKQTEGLLSSPPPSRRRVRVEEGRVEGANFLR
jgi:hypothetical protein